MNLGRRAEVLTFWWVVSHGCDRRHVSEACPLDMDDGTEHPMLCGAAISVAQPGCRAPPAPGTFESYCGHCAQRSMELVGLRQRRDQFHF
ncbi:hypothetical protein GCM10023222_39750 [Saccharopolyspora cebuensis]